MTAQSKRKARSNKIGSFYAANLSIDGIELTADFKNAFDLMESTKKNMFVTGKAGTGKSTLLRYFRAKTKKEVVVVAPTGIAAVSIDGQTIHSFFWFPLHFVRKDDVKVVYRSKKIFEKLDTLIIDEVSMVRADIMDAIDYSLRLNRGKMGEPFGGVQIVAFGDLHQIPPVVNSELSKVFERKYESPFFFSANIMKEIQFENVELSRIFRQSDEEFIELLNKVRNRTYTQQDLNKLNERVGISPSRAKSDEITLTATNERASQINNQRLSGLPGKAFEFSADISGEYPESSYPCDPKLALKKGAQVMMIKNDPNKRWVNGSIGLVTKMSGTNIHVSINNNVYDIQPQAWHNIRYIYDEPTGKIEPKIIGSFEQYPIKLAWAITIHKSQGQTLDSVVIELEGGAFTHGQVYVALSRCRTFEGIRLMRPINHHDVIFDDRVASYINRFVDQTKEVKIINE